MAVTTLPVARCIPMCQLVRCGPRCGSSSLARTRESRVSAHSVHRACRAQGQFGKSIWKAIGHRPAAPLKKSPGQGQGVWLECGSHSIPLSALEPESRQPPRGSCVPGSGRWGVWARCGARKGAQLDGPCASWQRSSSVALLVLFPPAGMLWAGTSQGTQAAVPRGLRTGWGTCGRLGW